MSFDQNTVNQYQAQKEEMRKSEMNSLQQAYEYFNKKRASYEEYNKVEDKLEKLSRGVRSGMIVWGAIILFIFMGCIAGGAPAGICVLFFLVGGGLFGGGLFRKINNSRQITRYTEEHNRLYDEIMRHYKAYPQCPVGVQYTDPDIMRMLIEYMSSGRSDTVKEAINSLITDLNQARLENAQAELAQRIKNVEERL